MKDPYNCPYCQAEEGYPGGWGMSPQGWEDMKEKHDKYHKGGEKEHGN